MFLAVMWFPAPQVWSPFVFFGILWSIVVSVMVLVVTAALVWSLSEPQQQAVRRDYNAKATMKMQMMRQSFALRLQNRGKIKACVEWVTS